MNANNDNKPVDNNQPDDQINDNNKQTTDSTDNSMNLSAFGKKRFFGRKSDSTEAHSKSIDGQSSGQSKKSQNKWSTVSTSNSSNQLSNNGSNQTTNGYKSAQNDLQNEDKFLGEGIQFNAKLIGHEFVAEARGEQMCQQSLKKLKVRKWPSIACINYMIDM